MKDLERRLSRIEREHFPPSTDKLVTCIYAKSDADAQGQIAALPPEARADDAMIIVISPARWNAPAADH